MFRLNWTRWHTLRHFHWQLASHHFPPTVLCWGSKYQEFLDDQKAHQSKDICRRRMYLPYLVERALPGEEYCIWCFLISTEMSSLVAQQTDFFAIALSKNLKILCDCDPRCSLLDVRCRLDYCKRHEFQRRRQFSHFFSRFSISGPSFFFSSAVALAASIGSTTKISASSTKRNATRLLRLVIRIDPGNVWRKKSQIGDFTVPLESLFRYLFSGGDIRWRKSSSSKLSSNRTHGVPEYWSHLRKSSNIFALVVWRLGISSRSTISRQLCWKRTALLEWTQRIHVSGDRSRIRYVYSIASWDFLSFVRHLILRDHFFKSTHPIPPNPTSANLEPLPGLFWAIFWSILSRIVPWVTKSGSLGNGTVDTGERIECWECSKEKLWISPRYLFEVFWAYPDAYKYAYWSGALLIPICCPELPSRIAVPK